MDPAYTDTAVARPPAQSDRDLLNAARAGGRLARLELWRRHSEYGLALARGLAPDDDWEAMSTRAWVHILNPTNTEQPPDGFRPYLYLVIRAVSSVEDNQPGSESFLTAAFFALPDEKREVLWLSHVEGMKPSEMTVFMGLEIPGVTPLLHHARQELRQQWAHQHAMAQRPGSICRKVWESSFDLLHNLLPENEAVLMRAHLRTCRYCKSATSDAIDVASHLRDQLLPTIAGPGGAATLLAFLNANGPCVRAMTELPHDIIRLFFTPLEPADKAAAQTTRAPALTPEPDDTEETDEEEIAEPSQRRTTRLSPFTIGVLAVVITAVVGAAIFGISQIWASPSQPSSPRSTQPLGAVTTQIQSVDTGALNNLFPIISGTTDPGASVEVQISDLDFTVTADAQGNWTTADHVNDLSSIRGLVTAGKTGSANPVSVVFEIALPPDLAPTPVGGGVSITATGIADADMEILADGESAATLTLDSSGNASADIALEPGTHFLQARYVDQSRVGPSSTAVTVTVG